MAVFLLFCLWAFFYHFGLNKLIGVGPWWSFVLHLEKLAQVSIENSLSSQVGWMPFLSGSPECDTSGPLCGLNDFSGRAGVCFNSILSQISSFSYNEHVLSALLCVFDCGDQFPG